MSNKKSTKKRNAENVRANIHDIVMTSIFSNRTNTALFIGMFFKDRSLNGGSHSDKYCGFALNKSFFQLLDDYTLNEIFTIDWTNNKATLTAYGKNIIRDNGQIIKPRLFTDYFFTLNDMDTTLREYDKKHNTHYANLKNYGLKSEPFYGIPVNDKTKDEIFKQDALIYLYSDSTATTEKTKRIAQLKFFKDLSSAFNFPIKSDIKQMLIDNNTPSFHYGFYDDEI